MKLSRVLMVCLFLVAGLTAGAQAEIRTIPMGTEQSRLTLVSQDDNAMVYDVEVGSLTAMDVETKEGTFTRLVIPEFYASTREGWPQLPMMNRLVEIPYGASASVEVVSSSSRTIDLADYGITHQIFPAQPSMPKSADPAAWPFVIDRSAYAGARVVQDLAGIVDLGTLRSAHMGRVEISPVEYLPTQNRIIVHDQVRVRVTFAGADPALEQEFKARTYSPFFEGLYERIDGYRGFHSQYPDRVRDVVTLVVVTPPQYAAQMQPFVNWKTRRGFNTILAVTGTPQVGTTKESIQAYLFGLYNNGTPPQPAPSFVVFVGDVDVMPTWLEAGDPTDRRYCAVDADLMPDMYYGRLSCANPTQLQAILDKTLMYDQFTMPDPSYLSRVTMIAGVDGTYGQVWANGQINYGTSMYFNAAHGIQSQTHLYPASGSQDAAIVAEVSQGVAYVNYTAHGSETSWADPTFTQTDVNGLQNNGKYCLAVGNCCLTSHYDYSSECIAETFLRVANKGAIGYIGGSNSTYWDEDYYWGVGYRTSIVEHPVFDPLRMGAYDGLFHDHGEAMTQWYVTNDALVFCGNLAVTESGSSRITYYWNIYNLMGDPSLSTFLGVPTAHAVTHPTTVFTTWSSIPITAVPNSYVGLTKDGVLIGAGTTDAAGQLTLPIWASPLTPGLAHLVVMAQNKVPYQADLTIIVPAVVTMNPDAIDANVTTTVDIGVYEYDGVTPKPGVEVWASGLQYESAHATTGVDGHCSLSVTYPYGPSIDIVGKNPAESWNLFQLPLEVRALSLNRPDLWVTTGIGLTDTLALNLPGTLHAFVAEGDHTLFALLNGTLVGSTGATTLDLTPDATGTLRGIIAVNGYDLYDENFPVIEAYGTLSGHVDANGQPASGAVVKGYDQGGQVVFQSTANAQGNYTMPDPILCATYTIKVDYFGYLHWEQAFFVNYGANTLPVNLVPAPAGVITGAVTEAGTGLPLDATVRIYRSDTMALYTQVATDPATGVFTTGSLPYFNWVVVVRSWHHSPQTATVTVDQPSVTRDFVLATTIGDILLIDNAVKGGSAPPKVDEVTGAMLEPGYDLGTKDAAADIATDLDNLGFNVTVEDLTSNPVNWTTYDLLIVSCGANTATLDATIKTALISYVNGGGHLLLEGGEVGYDHYGDAAFASAVMHITGWSSDNSGSPTVAVPTHYVMSVPNVIAEPLTLTYVGYGDSDALTAATGTGIVVAGSWTTQAGKASVLCYDTNPAPEGGSSVFFSFNYSALDATKRADLLHNAVVWLTTPESGNCSVAGTATLAGQSDHAGIKVEAIPGGGSTYTDALGAYSLPGLFAGTYTIRASKAGWTTVEQQVALASGQQLTGVNFELLPYGTLSGHVDANGQPAAGAVVKGYDGGGTLAFQATANAQGDYTVAAPIVCGTYTIKVDYFGYLHWEQAFSVVYGANTLPINLAPASAGVITGTVTEEGTGLPLGATVKVYRSDTMALYTEGTTDPATGVFTTAGLPYFDWVVVVRAAQHSPQTVTVTVDQPSVTRDFALSPTIGDILVIDNAVKGGLVPPRMDEKTGVVLDPGYDLGTKDAAADIQADLVNLGYNVTVEDLTSNPATWTTYDLVIVSCGANGSSLNTTIKPALIAYVNGGGHLLLEGGEVGYTHRSDASFASTVMHITGWAADNSGSPTVAVPTHHVMSVPNVITGPIALAYVGYADSDALTAATGPVVAGSWTTQAGKSSVLCYDPNPAPEGGSFVFFSFNYSVLDATKRADLLHNAVVWLTTPESGNCSISGTVTLAGQSDHSGILVQATPGGGSTYTDALGAYSLPGLYAGTYTVRASKQGWTTAQQQVTLTSGQQLTDLNFSLTQIYQDTVCRTPNVVIPDNNPTGVTDNMTVAMGATVSSLEVYVRITHTYQGDLIVKLRSPAGTDVILHNRTGSGTDNIVGWYPSPLVPAQSLDAFIGQSTDGVWKLIVSDNAGSDTGTLNEWCLRISHPLSAGVPEVKAAALALDQSQPNPARGATAIRFDLTRTAAVDLAVFDIAGRRVKTLFSGIGEAGSHEAAWRGVDEAGRVMPSGIYFYRLQAEGRTLTRKLMLLQ